MNEQVIQIAKRIKELREVLEMSLEDVSMQLPRGVPHPPVPLRPRGVPPLPGCPLSRPGHRRGRFRIRPCIQGSSFPPALCHGKELREVLEMSLEDVSMQLGVCIEDYRRYEEGKDDIPIGVLYGAAALFQVDPTLLLTGAIWITCSFMVTHSFLFRRWPAAIF